MRALLIHFSCFIQASSCYSTLDFMRFLQPCLEAVCFASCGLLVPIIPPITIEWCHQVNITPNSNCTHVSLVLCLSFFCFSLSLCTVSWSPLAGMTMAPHLEGHEIAFNASDRKSWKKYARSMDEFLRRESVLHCVNAGGVRLLSLLDKKKTSFVFPAVHAGKGSLFCGQKVAIQ